MLKVCFYDEDAKKMTSECEEEGDKNLNYYTVQQENRNKMRESRTKEGWGR